jgi:hypothetical protein
MISQTGGCQLLVVKLQLERGAGRPTDEQELPERGHTTKLLDQLRFDPPDEPSFTAPSVDHPTERSSTKRAAIRLHPHRFDGQQRLFHVAILAQNWQ